ncbi:MAG: TolC family protein, partial [Verrucomicrobiota bacterium]|nr:TolC family protein [Verrucomicrobiota bacterium]
MRSFIYSLFFLLLGSFVIVQAEAPTSDSEGSVLLLSKALDQALSHNLGLTISRYEPEKQKDAVLIEAASFDVGAFANTQYRESQAASSSLAQGSFVNQSRVNIGLDKRLKGGASVRLGTSATRKETTTNGLLDPSASGAISLSIRQPLLLGAGAQVNLAPLVRSTAKQEQSIEILRAEIQDFITEVEIAYWNLAFSQASSLLVRSNLELANSLLAENVERSRLGLVTQLEVMQAQTELLKQQESSIIAGRAVQDAQDRLIALIGMDSLASNQPSQIFPVEPLQLVSNSKLPEMHLVVTTALQVDA